LDLKLIVALVENGHDRTLCKVLMTKCDRDRIRKEYMS